MGALSWLRRAPMAARALLAVGALAVAGGCGYRFSVPGGQLPGGARTLYVPVFRNGSFEPGVEAWFTDALREELARTGRDGGESSDATALGEVLEIAEAPTLTTSDQQVKAFTVRATAVVRIVRQQKQLTEVRVAGQEDYLPGATTLETEANRRNAIRRLSGSLMRQAFESLTAGF